MLCSLFSLPCQSQGNLQSNLKGHVVSVVETEYSFSSKFGEDERGEKKVSFQEFYDEYGRVYKWIKPNGDLVFYSYKPNNDTVSIITYSLSQVQYQRQSTNNFFAKHNKWILGSVWNKEVEKEFLYNKDGTLKEINEYKYRDGEPSLIGKDKYSYESGKTIIDSYYGWGGLNDHRVISVQGNTKTELIYNSGNYLIEKNVYSYSSSGLLLQSLKSVITPSGLAPQIPMKYKYNEYNDITQIPDRFGIIYPCKYEYDSQHNWIVKKIFELWRGKEHMKSWIERTYQYVGSQEEVAAMKRTVWENDSLMIHLSKIQWEQQIDSIQRLDSLKKVLNEISEKHLRKNETLYTAMACVQTIKNLSISEPNTFIFMEKNGAELFSPISFQYQMQLDRNCIAYYTDKMDYIMIIPVEQGSLFKSGLLICLGNDNRAYKPYAFSNKAISMIVRGLRKDKLIEIQ